MDGDVVSCSGSSQQVPISMPNRQRASAVGETGLIMGGNHVHGDIDPMSDDIIAKRRKSFALMLKGKSRNTVSPEELSSVREYVMTNVKDSKQEVLVQLSGTVSKLQEDVDTLRDSLSQHKIATANSLQVAAADSQRFTVDCGARLQHDISSVWQSINQRMQTCFDATGEKLREMRSMEAFAHDRMEQIVNSVRAELSATVAVRWASSVALMDQHRREFTHLMDELRESTRQQLDTTRSKILSDVASACDLQRKTIVRNDEATKEVALALQDRLDAITVSNNSFMTAMSRKTSAVEDSLRTAADTLKENSDLRIHTIEVETKRLSKILSEVESLPTRRVEWQIKAASVRLQTRGERSWFSPRFEAAGASDLQLELRMLPEDSSDIEGLDGGAKCSYGDCAVALWAGDVGLRLVCKLFIGSMSVQLHHTSDGRTPLSTGRMNCFLREQIQVQEDTLSIGIEILEAVWEIRNMPKPTSADKLRNKTGELLEGRLILHRHLNHRTMELVQEQVDLMRSRMVRRIEWRLQQASTLRRLFGEGECACSTPFEAAGMAGMQLIFYPSGYTGVKESFCSLFLSCPGGTALRCWLWAGKQKREARVSFEHAGLLGRTNFCRYDSCVEADDSVLLALEIEEAQQDTTESMWHEPRSRRSPSLDIHATHSRPQSALVSGPSVSVGLADRDSETRSTPPPANVVDRIESTMKFRKAPGKIALEDVKQLPSLWTTQPQINVSEGLEDFHQLSEVKGVMKKPFSARWMPSRLCSKEREGTRTSIATPPVATRYMMYAA
eukprot:TRINITY_DN7799_c0_g1_i1.p1 TRINITY_DN7799_c0_g1~~TRINITY_DN7799_c0_g1_i1.p1  ORF type:complete len:785 (-),score=146.40 TRINITY_DN7799_c0_g1_i1:150-2504(-)